MDIRENYEKVKDSIPDNVTLVAVSKTYPVKDIEEVYHLGQRDFGENRVQELIEKQIELPKDINWHLIGHLQTNKVKSVLPNVHLIHSVDRLKLLNKIQREAEDLNMQVSILLQLKIAKEDSKYGLKQEDFLNILKLADEGNFPNVVIKGLMGMATFTDDMDEVKEEFDYLKKTFDQYAKKYDWKILSMGMSADYELAVKEGSTMVRVGSSIFGNRS